MNIDVAGANYGWPVITFGREYVTGFRIGEGSRPGRRHAAASPMDAVDRALGHGFL